MEYIFTYLKGGIRSRHLLGLIGAACIGCVGFALLLQHVRDVLPCPLCVLQRYALLAMALFCLTGALADWPRTGAALGALASLSGLGLASYQLWVRANPGMLCGFDPVETFVNQLPMADWLPFMLYADGNCADDTFRLFWLSLPQWGMLSFSAFAVALVWLAWRREGSNAIA
ncbi:MAG: disulfide bond formation DsbB family protein [Burkholderiaceae bacterium]|nr:disulfide bond formation DsbB family protein [Burkholderiaceae bacterium]